MNIRGEFHNLCFGSALFFVSGTLLNTWHLRPVWLGWTALLLVLVLSLLGLFFGLRNCSIEEDHYDG